MGSMYRVDLPGNATSRPEASADLARPWHDRHRRSVLCGITGVGTRC